MIAQRPARHPNLNTNRFMSMLGDGDGDRMLDRFEAEIESELIKTLKSVGIKAFVKRDKFSLPHRSEKIVVVPFVSYLNAVLNYSKVFRPIVKELLDLDVFRVDFYFWADLFEYEGGQRIQDCGLKYHFRYRVRE